MTVTEHVPHMYCMHLLKLTPDVPPTASRRLPPSYHTPHSRSSNGGPETFTHSTAVAPPGHLEPVGKGSKPSAQAFVELAPLPRADRVQQRAACCAWEVWDSQERVSRFSAPKHPGTLRTPLQVDIIRLIALPRHRCLDTPSPALPG